MPPAWRKACRPWRRKPATEANPGAQGGGRHRLPSPARPRRGKPRAEPYIARQPVPATLTVAADPLLCRAALHGTGIDAAGLTSVCLLFGAMQVAIIAYGLSSGERMRLPQVVGFGPAVAGLVGLSAPGLSAPAPASAVLMLTAGVAWGVYSPRGKGYGNATVATAGNFLRASPFALLLSATLLGRSNHDPAGLLYAMVSGVGTPSGMPPCRGSPPPGPLRCSRACRSSRRPAGCCCSAGA